MLTSYHYREQSLDHLLPLPQKIIIVFPGIWNIQEKLFIQYIVQWGQISFFSVQNCQLFLLFENKWQQ